MEETQRGKNLPVLDVGVQRKNHGRRRTGVSAEPVDLSQLALATTRKIEKTSTEVKQIQEAVKTNFLFSHLSDDQMTIVIDAMELKKFKKHAFIIKQGEEGDNFFVIDDGECECYLDLKDGKAPNMVKHYTRGESFGELALMYNTPRAASVQAKTGVSLWAMDRGTFRKVLMYTTSQRRGQYEEFLGKVPLLSPMDRYQKSAISDALQERIYKDGAIIIEEGNTKDHVFYILCKGKAHATKDINDSGTQRVVMEYKEGDFFGELALLNDEPRAATVVAVGNSKVVYVDRDSFVRLLGPVEEVLQKSQGTYKRAEENVRRYLSDIKIDDDDDDIA